MIECTSLTKTHVVREHFFIIWRVFLCMESAKRKIVALLTVTNLKILKMWIYCNPHNTYNSGSKSPFGTRNKQGKSSHTQKKASESLLLTIEHTRYQVFQSLPQEKGDRGTDQIGSRQHPTQQKNLVQQWVQTKTADTGSVPAIFEREMHLKYSIYQFEQFLSIIERTSQMKRRP